MNKVAFWCRRLLLAVLFVLSLAWIETQGAQWLLRWRAQHLLADVRSLDVNHSRSPDAQRLIAKWGRWGAPVGDCNAEACIYRIAIVQVLPHALNGYPDPGVKNWLPRIVNRLGLRSSAVRAGFSVQHGIVSSKWFAAQVALPVSAWNFPPGQPRVIPNLAVSSGEFSSFPEAATGPVLHPYRRVRDWHGRYGVTAQFLPQEDAAEKTALMDFSLSCITQLSPCLDEGQILPAVARDLQQQKQSPPSR
jgi:hypothetical protein